MANALLMHDQDVASWACIRALYKVGAACCPPAGEADYATARAWPGMPIEPGSEHQGGTPSAADARSTRCGHGSRRAASCAAVGHTTRRDKGDRKRGLTFFVPASSAAVSPVSVAHAVERHPAHVFDCSCRPRRRRRCGSDVVLRRRHEQRRQHRASCLLNDGQTRSRVTAFGGNYIPPSRWLLRYDDQTTHGQSQPRRSRATHRTRSFIVECHVVHPCFSWWSAKRPRLSSFASSRQDLHDCIPGHLEARPADLHPRCRDEGRQIFAPWLSG